MIMEETICESCGGNIGVVGRQYICRVCKLPMSDEAIERSLDKVFQEYKGVNNVCKTHNGKNW